MSISLQEFAARSRALANQKQEKLENILTEGFVSKHTNCSNLNELFEASGFKCDTLEDIEAIPEDAWDVYIAKVSSFEKWAEMLQAAYEEYIKSKLGI